MTMVLSREDNLTYGMLICPGLNIKLAYSQNSYKSKIYFLINHFTSSFYYDERLGLCLRVIDKTPFQTSNMSTVFVLPHPGLPPPQLNAVTHSAVTSPGCNVTQLTGIALGNT